MATVLVIDDDQDVLRLLQTQLSENGHHVVVAQLGDEGVAKAMKIPPDLIMLDVFLPDSTGYQICNQFRNNASTRQIPIIMMTGAARFPNQQQFGLERGANEYISKPFNVIEIDGLIKKYIGAKNGMPNPSIHSFSRPAPVMEALPERRSAEPSDDMQAFTTFLEQSLAKKKAKALISDEELKPKMPSSSEEVGSGVVKISFMAPPDNHAAPASVNRFDSLQDPYEKAAKPAQRVVPEPAEEPRVAARKPEAEPDEMFSLPLDRPKAALPAALPEPETPIENASGHPTGQYIPPILASKERFIDFGMDVYALAGRLCSTHAETYLADQLLGHALPVGARITESRSVQSKTEFLALFERTLRDLRETAYWLMIVRKAGLLNLLTKTDLEKNCQTLTTLLVDFINSEKIRP